MKKHFLDLLYEYRYSTISDMKELKDNMRLPVNSECDKCCNEHKIRMSEKESKLHELDSLINGYLISHKMQ